MSLEDDLFDAILAAPDDPAPRLVYADYRLGRYAHDAHAELIIVQERLAALEATGLWRDAFSDEAEHLRARERDLITAVTRSFDRTLVATWRRGFVDTLPLDSYAPRHLAPKMHYPPFRIVRAIRLTSSEVDIAPIAEALAPMVRRVEDDFDGVTLAALPHIDEVRTMAHTTGTALGGLRELRRLELYEPDAAEPRAIAQAIPRLPPVKHLVLDTSAPLGPETIAALAHYRYPKSLASIALRAGGEGAERALIGLGSLYSHLEFMPRPERDPDLEARSNANIAHAYFAFDRHEAAAHHYDDAFCLSKGRYPGIADRYAEAATAAGIARRLTDPDPARDGLRHRLPMLLRWGQIDRVLAAAPNHRGSWALAGLRYRDDFELDDAESAFARALEGEEDAGALAKAYALLLEDPPAALAILSRDAPSPHAKLLASCIHALESKPESALGLLRGELGPLVRLASGLFERQRGDVERSRDTWRVLAQHPGDETDPAEWVIAIFAATLVANDPYRWRRAFHDRLETAAPRAPSPALLFDPLLRVASLVMPQVDSTMVRREVDRLRGA